ncbi:MAG: cupin domain-containing protein [Anaeromyxobacter sp.]
MNERTIHNPVSGETATWIESSTESGGARTVIDFEVTPGGGVTGHRHTNHREQIAVLEGEIEVTCGGTTRRYGAGEVAVIEPRAVHHWRNPGQGVLRFRGTMTPGHPGFETFLRVWFGLARDGALRRSGLPRRVADMALLVDWDPSIAAGPLRLMAPLLRRAARRPSARARAGELLRRYDALPLGPGEAGTTSL